LFYYFTTSTVISQKRFYVHIVRRGPVFKQIVEAIASRDAELAEMLMRRHISGAWKTVKHLLDEELDEELNEELLNKPLLNEQDK